MMFTRLSLSAGCGSANMLAAVIILVSAITVNSLPAAQPPRMISTFESTKTRYFLPITQPQTLDCNATGIPFVEYEWYHNGQIIYNIPGIVEVTEGKLQLLTPTFNDQGSYQCFASNIHGKSMSTVTEMRIADLMGFPFLPIENLGSVEEGSHVVLTCRHQPRSVPAAVYDWFVGKSDVVIGLGRVVVDQGGDLHFINVEVGDELAGGKTYNCSLYNVMYKVRVYGSPATFNVTPAQGAVPQRPPTIAWFTHGDKAVALLGRMVTLQCIPDGYPLPTIEWSRRGGVLPVGRHVIDVDRYTLTISNVSEADEGTYVCTAVQSDQRSEQNIPLDVKSEPIWVEKPKSVVVTQGKTARFWCVARSALGEWDTVLIQWFKNGRPLKDGETGKVTVAGTKLTVPNVIKPYDLMNIQCNVSNSIGYRLADVFLNVIETTRLIVRPPDMLTIEPGNVIRVPILAEADPLYAHRLTYRWSKGGQAVSTNTSEAVYVDAANTLIINAKRKWTNPESLYLLGHYSCLVSLGLDGGEGDVFVTTNVDLNVDDGEILDPERVFNHGESVFVSGMHIVWKNFVLAFFLVLAVCEW